MLRNRHTRGVIRGRVAVGVLAAALLLSAPGCAPSPDPAESATPQAWQTMMDRWRSRAEAPAVVVGVQASDAAPWVGASGTSERNGQEALDPSATFRVASITKIFVAVVTLQLVEKGRLDLDKPLSAYRPALPYGHVTVRQLLNHTSGIPDYSQATDLGKELLTHRDRRWSSTEVIALIENNRPVFPAGTGYQYSNTDYVLLGEVISAVTGTNWARQVRDGILDPLHLDSTFIPGLEPVRLRPLPGYFDIDNDGDDEGVETDGTWPALETSEGPAGAMVSNAKDLLTFGDALFHGRLLHRRSFQAMVAEGQFHPRNSNYGLGLEIVRPDYQTTIWGHGGYLPGFRSVLWYVPSRDAVIVVLTNQSRANPPDLAELIMRTLPERTRQT
ncbi:MAG TPA: serine hydrolase domain-containing protein [Propionibacteriaceae bacterium]|nr:serine hydrolase domain-containing protein [Propionibacteriaceae bacterium]